VACFPFDDHNCPPIQLIISFCQSAYSWLKEDIENVVVVHCKAGMARTGLMISSLLLFLKVRFHTMFLNHHNEFDGNFNNHFISFIVCFNYGLAISLQFFPTAEESIDYYNQKRCFDGKGLVLPSQIVSLSFLCDNFMNP
jgi:phosphatidylinositol-3,4,5-trisphosphate 3-phosphatase/dual-specificity protein phosphatase PTEN